MSSLNCHNKITGLKKGHFTEKDYFIIKLLIIEP